MSLQYIIDGYNIIKHPLFSSSKRREKDSPYSLLDLIGTRRLCGSLKNKVIVVFDGYSSTWGARQYPGQINVVFSQEKSADERIKTIIENSENKKNIVVVSDDKEIVYFAKYAGAKPLSVEEFIGPALEPNRRPDQRDNPQDKNLSKQDLNYSQMSKINEELKKLWLK